MDAPSEIVEYDPRWPGDFSVLRNLLSELLHEVSHRIEHVGSTAVQGMAAKPIIDLDVIVPSDSDVAHATDLLAAAGFEPEGDLGVVGRQAFRPRLGLPYHHLYVVTESSEALRDHLEFRELLRGDAAARANYTEVKLSLADVLRTNRRAYADGKSAIIQRLLGGARERP